MSSLNINNRLLAKKVWTFFLNDVLQIEQNGRLCFRIRKGKDGYGLCIKEKSSNTESIFALAHDRYTMEEVDLDNSELKWLRMFGKCYLKNMSSSIHRSVADYISLKAFIKLGDVEYCNALISRAEKEMLMEKQVQKHKKINIAL